MNSIWYLGLSRSATLWLPCGGEGREESLSRGLWAAGRLLASRGWATASYKSAFTELRSESIEGTDEGGVVARASGSHGVFEGLLKVRREGVDGRGDVLLDVRVKAVFAIPEFAIGDDFLAPVGAHGLVSLVGRVLGLERGFAIEVNKPLGCVLVQAEFTEDRGRFLDEFGIEFIAFGGLEVGVLRRGRLRGLWLRLSGSLRLRRRFRRLGVLQAPIRVP